MFVWPSLYPNILENSLSCKIKHYKNPDNFYHWWGAVKVSLVVSVLETGGHSVQCLWTEKLEEGSVVYDK